MPLTYSWWTLHCNTVIWQITRPTAGIRAQPLVLYGEVTYTMYRLKTIWSMPISSPYHRMTTISHHCEWNNTKSMFSLLHCGHSIYCLAFKSNIFVLNIPLKQRTRVYLRQSQRLKRFWGIIWEWMNRHYQQTEASAVRDLKYLQPGGFSLVSVRYSACQTPEIAYI